LHLAAAALAVLLAPSPEATLSPESLSFSEFFDASPTALQPSRRLLSLVGKRVRLVGHMARMESSPKGGFYLCAFPTLITEGGGGTADLPPGAVLVVVGSAEGKELAHIPGPLEVTGILEIGPRADEEGRVSRIRILLEGPPSSVSQQSFDKR
jgi:hypothetical protein